MQKFSMTTFIFDLDGVLVDTAKYHYQAWKEVADKHELIFNKQLNEKLKGVSRSKCLDIILNASKKTISELTKHKILEEKNNLYLSYIETITPNEILPGVINTLDYARQNGISICLGSASKNARPILEKVELTNYFDCIIDGTHVSKAKPDPEVFLKGAELLGVPTSDCIVFEDSEAGIQAARMAGMKTVGIGEKRSLNKADIVLNSLEEINPKSLLNI